MTNRSLVFGWVARAAVILLICVGVAYAITPPKDPKIVTIDCLPAPGETPRVEMENGKHTLSGFVACAMESPQ